MTRIAALQMSSGSDVEANLARADELIAEAAEDGCALVVLPENFALMPERARDKAKYAERPGAGPIQDFLSDAAQRYDVWIVAGSMPLASPESERVYGACPVYAPDGTNRGIYRKIHLFDVDLPDGGESYRESHSMFPGDEPLTVDTAIGTVGLTICYDLRFPELYRHLVDEGATIFTVPAAFTRITGEAHWRTLLRARAIENLAWVIAAGQVGSHPDNRETWGHSMIVDPWGKVVAEQADGEGVIAADFNPDIVDGLRRKMPALDNRRLRQEQD